LNPTYSIFLYLIVVRTTLNDLWRSERFQITNFNNKWLKNKIKARYLFFYYKVKESKYKLLTTNKNLWSRYHLTDMIAKILSILHSKIKNRLFGNRKEPLIYHKFAQIKTLKTVTKHMWNTIHKMVLVINSKLC
jgi:hypothetical protein